MLIDAATRANLELTATLSGERQGSLIAAIDRTVTGAGARLLARRLAGPSTDPATIDRRLDAVAWMLADTGRRQAIRDELAAAPDLARALSRLTLDRGGPRDLAAIGDGLADRRAPSAASAGRRRCRRRDRRTRSRRLPAAPPDLVAALAAALADDLPHLKRDGGFVRDGYRAELDESRKLRDESRRVIAGLQAGYAADTDIRALRIKHNNVLGYFIEVGANARRRRCSSRRSTRASSTARRWQAPSASPPPSLPTLRRKSPAPANARWRSSWRSSPHSSPT